MKSIFHNLLSQPQFDCLGFADIGRLTEFEKARIVDCLDAALLSFISEVKVSHCIPQNDPKLRDDLWSWSRENLTDVCNCEEKVLDGVLEEAAACVEYYFPHAQHDTRLQMAISLAAAISADDNVTPAASRKAFANFQYDSWCGVPDSERDGWSKMYLNVIRNFAQYFGASDPRMGTFGANGWASYLEASFMEDSLAKALPPHFSQILPGMDDHGCCPDGFAYFFRSLTGAPGPFMLGTFKISKSLEVPMDYWITSVVPFTTFINLINDLLSFPKEVLAGEAHNYMSLQTQAKRQSGHLSAFSQQGNSDARWTFRDTLCETMDLLCDAIRSLDKAFIQFHSVCLNYCNNQWNTELASQAWTAFRNGYITWHIDRPRYGLNSLRNALAKNMVNAE